MKIVAYQGGLFICDDGRAVPRQGIIGEPSVGKSLLLSDDGTYKVVGEAKECGT